MEIEEDVASLITKILRVDNYFFGVNFRDETILIAILEILLCLSCAAKVTQVTGYELTIVETFLFIFLLLFLVITVILIFVSIILLKAAVNENPSIMSNYIWLTIVFMSVQLVLVIGIPLLLVTDGRCHLGSALLWMVILIVNIIGWTYFISVVNKYRTSLL